MFQRYFKRVNFVSQNDTLFFLYGVFDGFMKNWVLRYLPFGLFALITLIMMVATVVEKFYGSGFVREYIYGAVWMVALWGVAALFASVYIVKQKLYRKVPVFMLHLSFLLILAGAFVTYRYGVQGSVHLREGDDATNMFMTSQYERGEFPFSVQLTDFELQYYKGTFAPMDYVSSVVITDGDDLRRGVVSMNSIFKYRGYRFYQSGYDMDGKGATLSVAFDPFGIGITYAGYLCLLVSIFLFFFEPDSMFRQLLRHPALKRGALCVAMVLGALSADASPRSLPKDVAERFGNLHIYYNDRICPVQTLARDFTAKLCGKSSFNGFTAEQVLTGWFFFYDDWKQVPMIKIKGEDARSTLGIEGKYARLTDFTDADGYKLDAMIRSNSAAERKNGENANEKYSVISMLCSGSLLQIFPYSDSVSGNIIWYSLVDKLPSSTPRDESLFVDSCIYLMAEKIALKDWDSVNRLIDEIDSFQLSQAATVMPDSFLFNAEKFYNSSNYNRVVAMMCMTIGILLFLLTVLLNANNSAVWRIVQSLFKGLLWLVLIYLSVHIVLRGLISGHIPLSNGFETMQFMAWCSVVLTLCFGRRFHMALPFGFLLCGCTMMVAMMGESTPQVTQLMPVLQSPLLSVHVVLIMLAYTMFAFMMLNGVTAVCISALRGRAAERDIEHLYVISRIMLYPAIFLLAIGIFTGAVWANVSWGRYWGWDPKEVWALITMLIYSAAVHSQSLRCFGKPMFFHIFSIVAFISVLITYFGVNFILGGMHSYA